MKLTFQSSPSVTISTNTFINVPVILKYEETPLIEVIREQKIGFTTQIPIYHSDGTYLAKVIGNRVYPTEAGRKANIKIRNLAGKFICSLENKVVFILSHGVGDTFRAEAELYAPEGYFVKCTDSPELQLFDSIGSAIIIGKTLMINNTIKNFPIGIWLHKDGSCQIGAR